MTELEIWMIAIGLAMDCFTVSITGGIALKCTRWGVTLRTAFLFGLFQAVMPVIGWGCARWLSDYIGDYDHWIAFAMLFFLGAKMIYGAFTAKDGESCAFNPCDNKTVVLMALATSIDALAVGVSFAFIYGADFMSIAWPVSVIGFVSFAMSALGFVGGAWFSRFRRLKPEIVGGLILIAIGTKILIEHITKVI